MVYSSRLVCGKVGGVGVELGGDVEDGTAQLVAKPPTITRDRAIWII
jgi:hypothetical protein